MKSKDQLVRELIGSDTVAISVRFPVAFYQRLTAAGRRRFSMSTRQEMEQKAVLYACGLGLLDWEKALGPRPKGTTTKKK
jgi:hypothetical protein